MVEFQSWRDFYIFLRDYCNFSCLNCYYGGSDVDLNKEHTDSEYAHVFCKESISMVRLDLMSLCVNWHDKDTGKSLKEFGDARLFDLTDGQLDALNNRTEKWSIDEVRALINGEKTAEQESD